MSAPVPTQGETTQRIDQSGLMALRVSRGEAMQDPSDRDQPDEDDEFGGLDKFVPQ